MKEIWKDVPNYEGLYQVSNLGKVKSLDIQKKVSEKTLKKGYKPKITKGKILKPMENHKGYLLVSLYKNKKHQWKQIHRLVAQTFLENPNNYKIVNHKDENNQNNCVDNLEWCTNKYNIRYSFAKGVKQYNLNGEFIREWATITDAAKEFNIPTTNISKCCLGKRKTAGGFFWVYSKKTRN